MTEVNFIEDKLYDNLSTKSLDLANNFFNFFLKTIMNNLIKNEEKRPLCAGSSLGKRVNHLIGGLFSDSENSFFRHHHFKEPKVNVSEDEKAYYLEASLAGFKKEDVKLHCEHSILSVEAKKEEKKEESKKHYHCVECHCGSFFRSFELPGNVNASKIAAEMKDGLLKVTLPKSEAKALSESNVEIR